MTSLDKVLSLQETQDMGLSNTAELRRMIAGIRFLKEKACYDAGAEAPDIMRTHYTYILATYKPFVSVLSQYVRTAMQSNTTSMQCNFDTGNANFIGDLFVVVQFPQISLASLVAAPGVSFAPVPGYGRIRYCQYPGARLFTETSLLVNGKVVEQYTPNNMMDFLFHEVDVNKRETLARCLGQQQMQTAAYSWSFDQWQQPVAPDKQLYTMYTDGAQTPKNVQPPLTVVAPLLFNWMRDNEITMSNDYLNVKQRTVQFDIAPLSQIVSHYADMPLAVLPANFNFTSATVYARGIYMNADVAGLFMRKQKLIVRTWRQYTSTFNSPGAEPFSLDIVKYPVEAMYVKFIPQVNYQEATVVSGSNVPTYDFWYMGAQVNKSTLPVSVMSVNATTGTVFQNAITYQFAGLADVISDIGITVQNVDLFSGQLDPVTASQYLPFVETSIQRGAPFPGTYVFNFSQRFQGDFVRTAAGYLDFTTLPNKILNFTSSIITPTFPVTMQISVKSLNFIEAIENSGLVYTYPVV